MYDFCLLDCILDTEVFTEHLFSYPETEKKHLSLDLLVVLPDVVKLLIYSLDKSDSRTHFYFFYVVSFTFSVKK